MLQERIYERLVANLPETIILDCSDELIPIVTLVDTDSIVLAETLIRSMMNSDQFGTQFGLWAKLYCNLKTIDGRVNTEKFFKLNEYAYRLMLRLKRHKLYIDGILPYECVDVMEDGSIRLLKISHLNEFQRLTQSLPEHD